MTADGRDDLHVAHAGDDDNDEALLAVYQTITDDPDWKHGEFSIVSSDGVRFRVPAYYLLAHSAAVREAVADALATFVTARAPIPSTARIVALRDERLEASGTVKLFLECLAQGSSVALGATKTWHLAGSPSPDGSASRQRRSPNYLSWEVLVPLARLLHKFRCGAALEHLTWFLRGTGHGEREDVPPPMAVWAVGAALENDAVCAVGLQHLWAWYESCHRDSLGEPMPCGMSEWDIWPGDELPRALMEILPPRYVWALNTAWLCRDRRRAGYDLAARFQQRLETGSGCPHKGCGGIRHIYQGGGTDGLPGRWDDGLLRVEGEREGEEEDEEKTKEENEPEDREEYNTGDKENNGGREAARDGGDKRQ